MDGLMDGLLHQLPPALPPPLPPSIPLLPAAPSGAACSPATTASAIAAAPDLFGEAHRPCDKGVVLDVDENEILVRIRRPRIRRVVLPSVSPASSASSTSPASSASSAFSHNRHHNPEAA